MSDGRGRWFPADLVRFSATPAELDTPLDFWLYFLNNGAQLDADALPPELDRSEVRQAMGVLKMLAQNDLERELYEGRLKAKRDMQTLETERRMAEEQRQKEEELRRAAEAERSHWQERYDAAKRTIVRQIQLCERLLGRHPSDTEQLLAHSLDQLRDLAERLERELSH